MKARTELLSVPLVDRSLFADDAGTSPGLPPPLANEFPEEALSHLLDFEISTACTLCIEERVGEKKISHIFNITKQTVKKNLKLQNQVQISHSV
jgi:hypothetical protein